MLTTNQRGESPAHQERGNDMNKDLHEAYIELMKLGATQEDIIELFKIAYETANKIVNEQ